MKLFNIVKVDDKMAIGENLQDYLRDTIEKCDYLQFGCISKQYNQDLFLRDMKDSLDKTSEWNKKGTRQDYYKYAFVLTTDKYKIKGIIPF